MASIGASLLEVSPPAAAVLQSMQTTNSKFKMASTGAMASAISLPVATQPQPMQAADVNLKMAPAGAGLSAVSPSVASMSQPTQTADATPIMFALAPVRDPPTATNMNVITFHQTTAEGAQLQNTGPVSPTVQIHRENARACAEA